MSHDGPLEDPAHPTQAGPPAPRAALIIPSLIGPLALTTRDGGSPATIEFLNDGDPGSELGWHGKGFPPAVLQDTADQLADYFAGERQEFDLRLAPRGTDFHRRVWAELQLIPWGETITYGQLAVRLGLPVSAARAVGSANGANPIPVVIPCHRVIGADGTLTGYAGGLPRKAALLGLEGIAHELDQLPLF